MAVPARQVPATTRRRTPGRPGTRSPVWPVPDPARVRPRRRPRRRLPFALFSLVMVGVLVLGLAGAQALVAQGSFRLGELSRRTERLEERAAELRLRAAELASPARIARAAGRLGMVLPDPEDLEELMVPRGTR